MSSDGVSAVTVTRDEGKLGNADAPGSSGDRNAEADGREISRLRLYADLTYFPGYIDKSLYDEQRDPLRASAPRFDLRALKLIVSAQSASHRAPFPGPWQRRLPLAHTKLRGLEETPDRNLGFFRIVRLH